MQVFFSKKPVLSAPCHGNRFSEKVPLYILSAVFQKRTASYQICPQNRSFEKEKTACMRYLRAYVNRDNKIPETYHTKESSLLEKPGFRDLLFQTDKTQKIDWYQWANEDYPNGKNYYPNQLNVKVTDQLYVRSKSESLIALLFNELHIPYRYEWRLEGAKGWVLPDFIAPNKKEELICIEHLGRADQPWYVEDFGKKLPIYAEKGFYIGVNLFLTAEIQGKPLDLNEVRNMMKKIFL